MHRIDTPTAQKDKFGAGKNGFTRGNPQTGTPATDLDDDYFDMLQEELAGVVEATGVSLDKSKHNQLLTALKSLLLSRGHPFADIKSDGAAAVDEALSNLGLKSAAKRDVGTGTNQIPDMNSFTSGTNWMKFPSGKIIQWGYTPSSISAAVIVNFPIPFPTQCYGVTGAGTDSSAANIAGCQIIDKAGFNLSAWLVAAGSVFNRTATNISWIAVGI
ncbi:hypothetical protein POV92_09555 [Enterobacter roggenkampii]|uniref:gp53-like domain-containing protein n=3 Tax=Enterobacter roggenkampii TaxID=1812935 RepID=UPI00200490B8|nr:hypothetical protein [Enterobacter roggenkampii]MCK6913179.1 hypothetical protein [Enterobacter roggenkampii]MCK6949321.1 hypothetical protein [Enterobacter roggenkampii]